MKGADGRLMLIGVSLKMYFSHTRTREWVQEVSGILDCYNPTAPDPGTGLTDPDMTEYGDTVTATGHAVTAPATLITAAPASTKCPLCPTGKDGAP